MAATSLILGVKDYFGNKEFSDTGKTFKLFYRASAALCLLGTALVGASEGS